MKTQFKPTTIWSGMIVPFFLVLVLQLITCPLRGQVTQKKALSLKDYPKWGFLTLNKISSDGKWVYYTMSYQNGLDTAFIRNIKSLKTYSFPLGNNGNFIHEDWFTCKSSAGFHIINLKTGKQETIHNASQYIYASQTKYLLILTNENRDKTLVVRTAEGVIQDRISGITEFELDPTNQNLLYAVKTKTENTINLLKLSPENRKTILYKGAGIFSNLVWHEEGQALAFTQKNQEVGNDHSSIYYYNLANKRLHHYDPEIERDFPKDSLYIPDRSFKLQISDDKQKVFFTVHKKISSKDDPMGSDVQLWNGNAKLIYPKGKSNYMSNLYLSSWTPHNNQFQLISNDSLPEFMLSADQRYAILSNKKKYDPQYTQFGLTDYYSKDLATGKNKLFLEKQHAHFFMTMPSAKGKYIAYFRQRHWWVYDIQKQTHTNITKNIGHEFFQNKKEHPQREEPYLGLWWTPQDEEIVLYDAYDIWTIKPNGTSARRLTRGRETKTQFRVAGYSRSTPGTLNYNGFTSATINLNTDLILEASNNEIQSGYYRWSKGTTKKISGLQNSRQDQLLQSSNGEVAVYKEQRYDVSPRLLVQTNTDTVPTVIFQSNPQQEKFYWGKSELIQYKNAKGKSLKAVLYYPANYDSKKKYPMIVYIYERLSNGLHVYINPSQFTGDGMFNITTFTTQGYFVLAPDISYETGNPGVSATDCVVSATREVIGRGLVLSNKIGLTGHSFGGYQTDFIITQTNIFAAAVAGSAVTDLTSFYLSVGIASGIPDIWRFEDQQWRMGKSLFEDRAGYARNSPIEHVENITTPLFSWTGDADSQLPWQQSVELYVALRRLNKKHIMAVYPKENHTLSDPKNQKDLSIRINEWFDYYLKDAKPAGWIIKGIK